MKLKKILTFALAFGMITTFATQTNATESEIYTAEVKTSVYDPMIEQEEIDPNEALSGGMSRSTTGEIAKIEKMENGYNVTVRLLLQSSAKDVMFWQYNGEEYQALEHNVVGKNQENDSIDYQFETLDPYAPIMAEMFVIPMDRATEWFIELDKESISSDISLFEIEETQDFDELEDFEEFEEIEQSLEEQEELSQQLTENPTNTHTSTVLGVLLGLLVLIGIVFYIRKR